MGDLPSRKEVACMASCMQGIIETEISSKANIRFKNPEVNPLILSNDGVVKYVLYTNVEAGIDSISPRPT